MYAPLPVTKSSLVLVKRAIHYLRLATDRLQPLLVLVLAPPTEQLAERESSPSLQMSGYSLGLRFQAHGRRQTLHLLACRRTARGEDKEEKI